MPVMVVKSKDESDPTPKCRRCGSDRLAIKQRSGLEQVMYLITKRRKYYCLICNHAFRGRALRDLAARASAESAAGAAHAGETPPK